MLLADVNGVRRFPAFTIDEVVDTISKGAAGSWQMEHRARTMAAGEFEFGFAVEWMRKDLGICLDEADRLGARLPITALVDQLSAFSVRCDHITGECADDVVPTIDHHIQYKVHSQHGNPFFQVLAQRVVIDPASC